MQRSNWRYLGILIFVLVLSLAVVMTGLAESEIESPPDGENGAIEETVTEEITPTTGIGEVLSETLDAGLEVTTTVTIPTPLVVTTEITVTQPTTISLPIAAVGEKGLDLPVPTLYTVTPGIELTIYNDNLGLVKEVRELELEAGSNVYRFSDVPSLIDPTSVQVASLDDPQGLTVLEQNYEYDLVNSYSLLQKYVDQEITLMTKSGSVYSGTLLSGSDDLILFGASGVTIVTRDQVQEIAFPALPEGLITRPTLVWLLEAAEAGTQDVQVTYMTAGLSWKADYNLLFMPESEQLALTGWVTLQNDSGASYKDALLKLVAGDLNRVTVPAPMMISEARGVGGGTAPAVEERSFFEYHLYEIQRPVTVRDRQTKQIEFVSAGAVTASKQFVYEASPQAFVSRGGAVTDPNYGSLPDAAVRVELAFANDVASGMGFALPAGTMRVYQQDVDGGAELVGEDAIEHTPRGEQVTLYLGDAFDVVGEHVQTDFELLGEHSIEESYAVTLRNHKPDDIEVRVIEHLFRAQDAEVVTSSMDYEQVDASTIAYQLLLAADGQAVISYTVRYEW